jgi:hypothetical protein
MQRQRAPAILIGRGHDGRHHARALPLEERAEAPEVRRRELDVGAVGEQRALERPEEAGQVVHSAAREEFGADCEKRTVDA